MRQTIYLEVPETDEKVLSMNTINEDGTAYNGSKMVAIAPILGVILIAIIIASFAG